MKKLIVVLLSASLVLSLAACGGDSKLGQIRSAGKLTVYTNAEFPPYEYMEGDEIVGVDVEIAKAIAKEIGVELDMQNANFDGIVASIASGKGDLGISGFTITEQRQRIIDFSVPYVDSVQYMIIPDDSGLKVMEDFEGKSIGAQLGTTGEMLIQDEIDDGVLTGKGVDIKPYNGAPLAMEDLKLGRVAAVVIDELVAINIASVNPGYKAIPLLYESGSPVTEQFGVAVRKGQKDLLDVVNKVVKDMVSKGLIEQYIEQYDIGE